MPNLSEEFVLVRKVIPIVVATTTEMDAVVVRKFVPDSSTYSIESIGRRTLTSTGVTSLWWVAPTIPLTSSTLSSWKSLISSVCVIVRTTVVVRHLLILMIMIDIETRAPVVRARKQCTVHDHALLLGLGSLVVGSHHRIVRAQLGIRVLVLKASTAEVTEAGSVSAEIRALLQFAYRARSIFQVWVHLEFLVEAGCLDVDKGCPHGFQIGASVIESNTSWANRVLAAIRVNSCRSKSTT